MNLERLFIENYKQLRDPVELFPPEGAVGVVGRNGAGKSTLFEAILWAFFGSRGGGPRFQNELIPWSGGSTKDPTNVEVTLAVGGQSYTVRRSLKSNATTAEARDPSGKTIVTGTTDVTRWVEEHLLRMDRTAFEATFYARQKELKFFANDDGIGRVRKISKMLGISRVEDAQKLLRDDRNDLRAEARVIESRLAEADEESLKERLEEAQATCRRLEEELERISGEHEAATTDLEAAREARGTLETSHRKHTQLTGTLGEAEGDRRRAADRVEEAERDLAEISAAEEELGRLRPLIARLPDLEAELEEPGREPAARRTTRQGTQGAAYGPAQDLRDRGRGLGDPGRAGRRRGLPPRLGGPVRSGRRRALAGSRRGLRRRRGRAGAGRGTARRAQGSRDRPRRAGPGRGGGGGGRRASGGGTTRGGANLRRAGGSRRR